jgi:predicted enzyme related to lactoylglutathione lyase
VISFEVPGGPEIELVPGGQIVPPASDRIEAPLIAIFHVDDVAGFANRLVEHGGRIVNEPFLRGEFTLAYVADPEGHIVGLHSHSQTEDAKKS